MAEVGVTVVLLALHLQYASTLEVALFPSTGCYSHDVMMKQIGDTFDVKQHNVTWIQTFLYDFGFGEMKLKEEWNRISIFGHDEEGLNVMRTAGSLLWEQNVPTDFDRPWDLRGSFTFFKMLERHQTYCEKLLVDRRFLDFMNSQKADLVILDHFLQECIGGLSHLLNTSTVQFSNWPIADGYITSLNVPANPSATPKTGTPYTGLGMSFGERVGNFLFHNVIVITRIIQIHILNKLFERSGYPQMSIVASEAERTIYAGRSEFLFDVVRPINNRVKHFGGAGCGSPSDYVISLPRELTREDTRGLSREQQEDHVTRFTVGANVTSCDEDCCGANNTTRKARKGSHLKYRSHIYNSLSSQLVEERRQRVHTKFPNIDWEKIDNHTFILVSFGSVAQVDKMPSDRLRLLLRTFSAVSHTVLWQTNSPMDTVLKREKLEKPENVILVHWAPIKELLAHPNLQYIVCHGGINTINELLLFGVPVIGVPLQGDQGSNLRRLVDLGGAKIVSTVEMGRGKLAHAMREVEDNLLSYWSRSTKFAAMLNSYRSLHANDQSFWIGWTARHRKRLKDRNLLKFRYIGDEENLFYLCMFAIFCFALKVVS